MKRTDLMKQLRQIAKAKQVEIDLREGGNHTVVIIGGQRIAVPRHSEINEITARKIIEAAKGD